MQVWCDWQVTLCDPHLSALEVRFSRRCAIQIDVYLTLPYLYLHDLLVTLTSGMFACYVVTVCPRYYVVCVICCILDK